ncbi:MAG: hypothetical protein RIF39_03825, partial [Cyclobacteriaceae bacterium]
MAEPLKYMYDPEFFDHLCQVLKKTIPKFDDNQFIHAVFDTDWPELELKQRTRKVTLALHHILPKDFEKAAECLVKVSRIYLQEKYDKPLYPLIFLPDYVEVFGLDHFAQSMDALEQITQLISAEFAIRPFIVKYPLKTMRKMKQWSKHKNHHVRRLSSEGCRPRLPWVMGLPAFKNDPSPILPVLENLKNDKSEYVRRSVANNLNDIAKDHPEIVLKIAKQWKDISPATISDQFGFFKITLDNPDQEAELHFSKRSFLDTLIVLKTDVQFINMLMLPENLTIAEVQPIKDTVEVVIGPIA